ncbi:hypothetical protein E2P81_ATG10794 [Venturia nashicola]|nr:hypothetical protein E2P81_ATG10794 [Venturia nashicola]
MWDASNSSAAQPSGTKRFPSSWAKSESDFKTALAWFRAANAFSLSCLVLEYHFRARLPRPSNTMHQFTQVKAHLVGSFPAIDAESAMRTTRAGLEDLLFQMVKRRHRHRLASGYVRFQICLQGIGSFSMYVLPEYKPQMEQLAFRALRKDIARIAQELPEADLAI